MAVMRLLSDYKSCVEQRPVALPNAEEGFRSFLMSLRNFERMWEDGTADSLSLSDVPSHPRLASTDNFQRRRCQIHKLRSPSPSGSIFVCDGLSGRLISEAVSPAAAASSSSHGPRLVTKYFQRLSHSKLPLNLMAMPACLLLVRLLLSR